MGDHNRAIKAYNEQVLTYQALQQQARQAEQAERQAQLKMAKAVKKAQTRKNARKSPLEPQKSKNGINIPPTPKNTLKTQNRAIHSDNLLLSKQYHQNLAFLQEFDERVEKIAQNILANQLQALKKRANPF